MVFGIINTMGELFKFVTMVTYTATELGGSSSVDVGLLAIPVTYTILILAHAICTIVMVRKEKTQKQLKAVL